MSSNGLMKPASIPKHGCQKPLPGPWPWYVLVLVGLAVSGFFAWLMLVWGLYQRGKKATASLTLAINFIIWIGSGWALLTLKMPWWRLTVSIYLFNLAWAISSWLFQRKTLGCAERRYKISEWKSWITPIAIGVIIGICFGTVFSIAPAFENRTEMQLALDSLDRQTVLWDFFTYSSLGLVAGLFLGFWWAGEQQRFRTSHVISFLSAFVLTITFWDLFWLFLSFLVHKGALKQNLASDLSDWAIIPPWVCGFHKSLLQMRSFDILSLIVVALLFGAASRIRDFGKRALLIPLTFIIGFPMSFSANEWWEDIQDQIIYDMRSPDAQTKTSAHEWAEILLTRYPNHLKWPEIAEDLAQYYYQRGEFEPSRSFYQKIIDRYGDSNQWYWVSMRARAALDDPDFGKPSSGRRLEIPMVDYEDYLTHNWMALLSVIRYWKGEEVSESEVIIKLKNLSMSDDKIELNPIVSLADLDDATRSLGYEVLILPADLANVKALVEAGIPVIHRCYNTFNVIFGFDENRSVVCAYSFKQLSSRLRKENRKEAREILSIGTKGRGESKKRLTRIANESYIEYSTTYWESPVLRYMGPLLAVVFPVQKTDIIAKALNTPLTKLKKESNGYLASLIGLSYLNHADPVYAVEWAKIGAQLTKDPFPLYVAHLAYVWWTSRNKMITSNLRLQDQIPELAQIFSYFNVPENLEFLKRSRFRFEQDLNNDMLPWIITQIYIQMLDRSNSSDLTRIMKLMHARVAINPDSSPDWEFLASTYEWSNDMPGLVKALTGAISANPLDYDAKLRLAVGYVSLEHYADAKAVLETIAAQSVKYDADYSFSLGAVAEWKGDVKTALRKYDEAIEMRRYKPQYGTALEARYEQ